jgi:hypothetical protein
VQNRRLITQVFVWLMAVAAIVAAGCGQDNAASDYNSGDGGAAAGDTRTITTAHYLIHTTIDDPTATADLARVMEGAYVQYCKLVPSVEPVGQAPATEPRPLECWVFANRAQWAQFTQTHTGDDAPKYLQINRGGYTLGDVCALYSFGRDSTNTVAAHEGWHQFVARHFRVRPPPFLEEGIATTFETITWTDGQPHFSPNNPKRAAALHDAVRSHALWPTDKLISMHAGDVVGLRGYQIEAFYAQDWAFARFMMEGERGRFRPALLRLLVDCQAGTAYDGLRGASVAPARLRMLGGYDPAAIRPLLERYFQMPMADIDNRFQLYVQGLCS